MLFALLNNMVLIRLILIVLSCKHMYSPYTRSQEPMLQDHKTQAARSIQAFAFIAKREVGYSMDVGMFNGLFDDNFRTVVQIASKFGR